MTDARQALTKIKASDRDLDANLGELIEEFIKTDQGAREWFEDSDSEDDCHPLSQRFTSFLNHHGMKARFVEVEASAPSDPMVGPYHAMVEVDGLNVDWTARQFYNVEGFEMEISTIPCPLIYPSGLRYPLWGVVITKKESA